MQNNYRYCEKCQVLFFDGDPNKGVCHSGGGHQSQGYNFFLPCDALPGKKVPQTSNAQTTWFGCHKCFSLFWGGYATPGLCPAGGAHEHTGTRVFTLPHDLPPNSLSQDNWRFCERCYSMFYDGYQTKGSCPAGGGHVSQGFMFVLPHDLPSVLNYDVNSITFPSGIAAGGDAHLVLNSNGAYSYSGHFHDSGAVGYNTACVFAVEDSQKNVYTFTHSGSVGGTITLESRDDNWNVQGTYATIEAAWPYLAVGSKLHEEHSVSLDVVALLGSLLKGLAYAVKALSVVSNSGGGISGAQSDPNDDEGDDS